MMSRNKAQTSLNSRSSLHQSALRRCWQLSVSSASSNRIRHGTQPCFEHNSVVLPGRSVPPRSPRTSSNLFSLESGTSSQLVNNCFKQQSRPYSTGNQVKQKTCRLILKMISEGSSFRGTNCQTRTERKSSRPQTTA